MGAVAPPSDDHFYPGLAPRSLADFYRKPLKEKTTEELVHEWARDIGKSEVHDG
jgi:hypothetical protein